MLPLDSRKVFFFYIMIKSRKGDTVRPWEYEGRENQKLEKCLKNCVSESRGEITVKQDFIFILKSLYMESCGNL